MREREGGRVTILLSKGIKKVGDNLILWRKRKRRRKREMCE